MMSGGAGASWRTDGLNLVTGVDLGVHVVTRHSYDLLGRRTATMRGNRTGAASGLG